jgi:PAS domain S-box-containing protein
MSRADTESWNKPDVAGAPCPRSVIDDLPRRVAENLPLGVALMAPSGELEFVNKHICAYFGKTLDELRSWGTGNEVHPEDLPRVVAGMTHSLATGDPYDVEERLLRFDGVYRWFQVRGAPERDAQGRIVRWYIVHLDIDDRKRAEEAVRADNDALKRADAELKRSETLLAAGQQLSSTGTFSWRLDTEELSFSEELYRIFELDPGTVVTHDRITELIHPEDRSILFRRRSSIRAAQGRQYSRRPSATHDIRVKLPDGRIKYIQSQGRVIQSPDGHLEWVGAIQDVTQRKQAEGALDQVRSELAHAARVMSLGVLTASIAHELNQPLTGIVTNANACLHMLAAAPPNVAGALETARRNIRDSQRAAEVITRLRALFANKEFAAEAVDLNQATREVLALSAHELQRRHVVVQAELDRSLPCVTGDRVQLQQVILNLLLNACDSMNSVADRPREIFVQTACEPAGAARVTVRDTGVGLVADALEKLFDSFYTTKPDGMGIGLSVSRSIIERHRGQLWASQNDGPGTAFSFSIPGGPHRVRGSSQR